MASDTTWWQPRAMHDAVVAVHERETGKRTSGGNQTRQWLALPADTRLLIVAAVVVVTSATLVGGRGRCKPDGIDEKIQGSNLRSDHRGLDQNVDVDEAGVASRASLAFAILLGDFGTRPTSNGIKIV